MAELVVPGNGSAQVRYSDDERVKGGRSVASAVVMECDRVTTLDPISSLVTLEVLRTVIN